MGFALHHDIQPIPTKTASSGGPFGSSGIVTKILRSKTYIPADAPDSECSAPNNAKNKQEPESKHPPLSVTTFGSNAPSWLEAEVSLKVDKSLQRSPEAFQALSAAVQAWTSAASQLPRVSLSLIESEDDDPGSERGRADHRISYAPGGDARAEGALAITVLTIDEEKNAILDADIIINGAYRFREFDTDRSWGEAPEYDLQNVLTHEMGHWFGLPEAPCDSEATMYRYTQPNEVKKRDLTQDDVDAVQVAYWQADNPSGEVGCSFVSRRSGSAGFGLACAAAAVLLARARPSKRRPGTSTGVG